MILFMNNPFNEQTKDATHGNSKENVERKTFLSSPYPQTVYVSC